MPGHGMSSLLKNARASRCLTAGLWPLPHVSGLDLNAKGRILCLLARALKTSSPMRITFMICNQRGILVEALGKPIALLCEFVEELEGEEPEWLDFIRCPVYVIEYQSSGERREYSPAEASACFRRLRGLAVQHGKQWTNDSRWPQNWWDDEYLVEWLDWTIETLESQPPDSRIYALEQHG